VKLLFHFRINILRHMNLYVFIDVSMSREFISSVTPLNNVNDTQGDPTIVVCIEYKAVYNYSYKNGTSSLNRRVYSNAAPG